MNLSAELFESIVARLSEPDSGFDGATPREQRREPRVGVRASVTLVPFTDRIASVPLEVPVRDLSPGGIGFLHETKIALDEQFVLQLPSSRGPVTLLCGVVYWQPLREGTFAIGAKFLRLLSGAQDSESSSTPILKRRAS